MEVIKPYERLSLNEASKNHLKSFEFENNKKEIENIVEKKSDPLKNNLDLINLFDDKNEDKEGISKI